MLAGSTRADAAAAFRAIALAAPGGLGGRAAHDVRAPAARDAAGGDGGGGRARPDRARSGRDGSPTCSTSACPAMRRRAARWPDPRWATLAVYLGFLAAFPDSHVARTPWRPRRRGAPRPRRRLRGPARRRRRPARLLPDLLAWDAALKRRGINPGTSADLTVATLFAARLATNVLAGAAPDDG